MNTCHSIEIKSEEEATRDTSTSTGRLPRTSKGAGTTARISPIPGAEASSIVAITTGALQTRRSLSKRIIKKEIGKTPTKSRMISIDRWGNIGSKLDLLRANKKSRKPPKLPQTNSMRRWTNTGRKLHKKKKMLLLKPKINLRKLDNL